MWQQQLTKIMRRQRRIEGCTKHIQCSTEGGVKTVRLCGRANEQSGDTWLNDHWEQVRVGEAETGKMTELNEQNQMKTQAAI